MARLNWDKDKKIIWSLVSREDFNQSFSNEEDIPIVLEEIQKSFPQNQTCLIIYTNKQNQSIALLKMVDEKKMNKINEFYEVNIKNQLLEINFNQKNLIEAEKELFKKILKEDFPNNF